jgi:ribosome-associated toxin RatA of RatAB toxin-antitoxin module
VPRRVSFSKNIHRDHRQIFNHIANFENYSSYIPGCTNAKLIQKEDEYEVGELEFNFLLRNYSIKSKNFLLENTILIKQIEGPFESFDGEWKVSEIDNQNTEVTFKAEFQLPFLLNNLLPDKVIDNFCKVAIEAFVDRVTKE